MNINTLKSTTIEYCENTYVLCCNYSKHIQNNPIIPIKINKNEVIYTSINFKDINNVIITKQKLGR